jgi:hypothetical protein
MNPPPPAATCAAYVKKDCGFPWWVLLLLLGAVAVVLAWVYFRQRQLKKLIPQPEDLMPVNDATANQNIQMNAGGQVNQQQAPQQLANGQQQQQRRQQSNMGAQYGSPAGYGNAKPSLPRGNSDMIRNLTANGKPALIVYTMPRCSFCDIAKPELIKAAKCLNIPVFEVDRTDLNPRERPLGYPYIFVLAPNGQKIEYRGERTANNFISHVERALGSQAINQSAIAHMQ